MKTQFHTNLLIFVILLMSVSCKDVTSKNTSALVSEKECIETILKLDDSLGTVRNHACEKMTLSETISEYSDALKALPFNNCPEDFKTVFKSHENAWRSMLEVSDKYPELRGEMHELFDQIEISKDSTEFKKLLKAIWDTWKPIELAAQ